MAFEEIVKNQHLEEKSEQVEEWKIQAVHERNMQK